jgi:uncharacterized protein YecA (UPF0149 family)
MNPHTGDIFMIQGEDPEALKSLIDNAKLVELSQEQVEMLQPMSKPKRKNWMRNEPCPCKSGKKFKRCCWSKFS